MDELIQNSGNGRRKEPKLDSLLQESMQKEKRRRVCVYCESQEATNSKLFFTLKKCWQYHQTYLTQRKKRNIERERNREKERKRERERERERE